MLEQNNKLAKMSEDNLAIEYSHYLQLLAVKYSTRRRIATKFIDQKNYLSYSQFKDYYILRLVGKHEDSFINKLVGQMQSEIINP